MVSPGPGAHSLFTLDCRRFPSASAEALLFGERSSAGAQAAICLGKLNLSLAADFSYGTAESLPPSRRAVWRGWSANLCCARASRHSVADDLHSSDYMPLSCILILLRC